MARFKMMTQFAYACPVWKVTNCHGDWGGDECSDAVMLAVRTSCPETCSWSSH